MDTEIQASEAPQPEVAVEEKPGLIDQLKEKATQGVAPSIKDPAQIAAEAAPKYEPNYKFRANNKEHEIPEVLRSALKDAESEKYIKKLYERAYGFDGVQQRYKETRDSFNEMSQTHNQVMSQIQEAQQAYRSNDMDSVFEIMRISPEKVLQWAVEKVQLSQLPPEQRQLHEARVMAERQNRDMQKQQQYYQQESMQNQGQIFQEMLEVVLERPNVSAIAQEYDQAKGTPGAFRSLVIRVGQSEAALSGKTLTPLQAAEKALELLGRSAPAAQPAQATAQPAQQATPAAQVQPAKKVIPNMANAGAKSTSSPAKKPMKSIDDLKRKYDEIAAHK